MQGRYLVKKVPCKFRQCLKGLSCVPFCLLPGFKRRGLNVSVDLAARIPFVRLSARNRELRRNDVFDLEARFRITVFYSNTGRMDSGKIA